MCVPVKISHILPTMNVFNINFFGPAYSLEDFIQQPPKFINDIYSINFLRINNKNSCNNVSIKVPLFLFIILFAEINTKQKYISCAYFNFCCT